LDRCLPPEVFRAKRLIHLDTEKTAYVFQLCGTRAAFEPYEGPLTHGRLDFIGRGIDPEALGRQLEDCLEA
jgi:Cobalamin synthesis protein cobW C-terminal domain